VVGTLPRDVVVNEIGELFQRLANGGSVNALEMRAIQEHIEQSLLNPSSPMTAYYCNQRRDDSTTCGAVLTETNAPYGRARQRCRVCGKWNTVYYGGYQRYANSRNGNS
jgi:hypothetical protein